MTVTCSRARQAGRGDVLGACLAWINKRTRGWRMRARPQLEERQERWGLFMALFNILAICAHCRPCTSGDQTHKAHSAAMSAWINSNRGIKRRRRGRKTAYKPMGSIVPQSTAPMKKSRNRKAAAPSAPAQPKSVTRTPLRIPYGNKEVALKLGARYGSAGWHTPPGIDLAAFDERGWL